MLHCRGQHSASPVSLATLWRVSRSLFLFPAVLIVLGHASALAQSQAGKDGERRSIPNDLRVLVPKTDADASTLAANLKRLRTEYEITQKQWSAILNKHDVRYDPESQRTHVLCSTDVDSLNSDLQRNETRQAYIAALQRANIADLQKLDTALFSSLPQNATEKIPDPIPHKPFVWQSHCQISYCLSKKRRSDCQASDGCSWKFGSCGPN